MKTTLHGIEPAIEQYDLPVYGASEINRGFNLHYRLETAEGDKHLIIYRQQPGKPPQDLQFQIQEHLREHGFDRVPRAVPTTSGRPTARTALGTVAMTDWVPGEATPAGDGWPIPLVQQAAEVLADLHLALRDFHPDGANGAGLGPLYLPADRWLAKAPELMEEFAEWTEESPAVVANVAGQLAGIAAYFDPDDYAAALEEGASVVHGDYRPANLVLDDGKIAAVLDFDSAFRESRVYDLAYACFQFVGEECVYPQERSDPGVSFVERYVERWPLSEAEQRLFPFFLRQVVLKRLLRGWDVAPRLSLLEQIEGDLGQALTRAATGQQAGAPGPRPRA